MSDDEVADWFRFEDCNDDDTEDAAQYTNGVSVLFLLARHNVIAVGERLVEFHNQYSLSKVGRKTIYISRNVVEAFRDIRMHFPKYAKQSCAQLDKAAIGNARRYAVKYLIDPISRHLSDQILLREKKEIINRQRFYSSWE